jgi:hypothetical protein
MFKVKLEGELVITKLAKSIRWWGVTVGDAAIDLLTGGKFILFFSRFLMVILPSQ